MLRIINPATEELIKEVAVDTEETVAAKFESAKAGLVEWKSRSLQERIEVLEKFGELLEARMDELALTLTTEMGKPIGQARGEIAGVQARLNFFVEHVAEVLQPNVLLQSRNGNLVERVSYDPLGIIGNISAWNYPYFVGSNVFVPALLAGNCVLYKPSEFATLTGIAIGICLHDAGVPESVFQTVVGGGAIGKALLEQPLAGLFFTCSYPTGVKVAEAAARGLMRLQLELGGKDPVYICEDVDVNVAAEAVADGAFYNTGQSCCSVERIYVAEGIYDDFVEHFATVVKGFKIGDPTDEKTYIGPLTRSEHLGYLEGQVEDAVSKGAQLLTGGKRLDGPGYFFAPTVFAGVDHSMSLMREESFGPIIGIQKVSDDDQAIGLMNDTEYGLTAGVYCAKRDRAEGILDRLEAGSAYWNCCDRVSPRLPWTGWKHSGVGSTLGIEGIRAFVRPKAWHLKKT